MCDTYTSLSYCIFAVNRVMCVFFLVFLLILLIILVTLFIKSVLYSSPLETSTVSRCNLSREKNPGARHLQKESKIYEQSSTQRDPIRGERHYMPTTIPGVLNRGEISPMGEILGIQGGNESF